MLPKKIGEKVADLDSNREILLVDKCEESDSSGPATIAFFSCYFAVIGWILFKLLS